MAFEPQGGAVWEAWAVSRLEESMADSSSGIALPTEALNEVTGARNLTTTASGSPEAAVPDFCAKAAGDDGRQTSAGLKLQDTRIVQESSISDSERVAAKAGEHAGLAHGESAAAASEFLRGLLAAGMSPESLVARLTAMFLGEGDAPRASQLGELTSEGLLLLVVAADAACTRFWKAHMDAVKR